MWHFDYNPLFNIMGGEMIPLLRVLRLKPSLQPTVTSKEFNDMNAFKSLAISILNNDFFTYLSMMCRAMYATMHILRLANNKVAAMDKLHYYVHQEDIILPLYLAEAETNAENLMTDNAKSTMETTVEAENLSSDSEDEGGIDDDDDE